MIVVPQEVRTVITSLEERGAVAAVGGSCLLSALGLAESAGDWDITTDASVDLVESAIQATGLRFTRSPAGDGRFASRARLRVDTSQQPLDIIIGFAVRSDGEVIELPTCVAFRWQGLPIGSPESWEKAYRLLGRQQQADLLQTYLSTE